MTGLDRELLIEIGCEEIPASWLPGLTAQLGRHLDARLKEFRLTGEGAAETYSTPRRLTARVAKLSERQSRLRGTRHRSARFRRVQTGRAANAGGHRLCEEVRR